MKWFEGSIIEAVATSQSNKCLFCAVILGDDEVSQALEESLESDGIQTIITNEKVICIRIASGSEEFLHFSRIWTNAKAPSIFCITKDAPADVFPATLDSAGLKARFESAVKRHKDIRAATEAAFDAQQARVPAGSSQVTGAPLSSASSNGDGQVPLESRIERAKIIAAAKLQKKAEEDAEEEKRREIERRQVGQKVAELKRWQEEQEIKKRAEERRKDKEQEAQLRQRLRDQIAQDRIDRQARVNMTSGVAPTTATDGPTSSSSAPSLNSNFSGQARLQFRLPEGTTKTHSFDPDSTLGHVRQYVIDHVVPYRDFSIWVAFPRREFTSTDYGTTLRDLGLLPSTALLIIPVTGKSIMHNAGQAGHGVVNFLTTIFGYVLSPVTFILTLLQRALPAPQNNSGPETASNANTRNPRNIGKSSPGTSSTSTKKPEAGTSTSNNERNTKTGGSQGKKGTDKGTTEGNVHRLRTFESDSDDEQATWNGNSTQQM